MSFNLFLMKSLNCFMKCLKGHFDKGYSSVQRCCAENKLSEMCINILTRTEADRTTEIGADICQDLALFI